MSDVKVEMTPSEQLTKDAKAPFDTTDARGRRITLCKPGLLAQYRLVELLGDTAKNQAYMGMILPITMVQAIDGEPVTYRTKRELDLAISLIDEDGLAAILSELQSRGMLAADGEAEVSPDQALDETRASLKNG